VPNNTSPLIAKASLSSIRVTPQKARRVVNMIRGQRADEAIRIAKFSPQVAVSEDLYSLLNSAVANAKQKNPAIREASELWVAEALVDEGFTLKRFRPRAQGRGYRIDKRTSTITLTVSDDRNYRSNTPKKVLRAAAKSVATDKSVAKDIATEVETDKPVAKKAAAKKAPAKKAAAKKAPAKSEGKAE